MPDPYDERRQWCVEKDDRDPVVANAAAAFRIVQYTEIVGARGDVALEVFAQDAVDLVFAGRGLV